MSETKENLYRGMGVNIEPKEDLGKGKMILKGRRFFEEMLKVGDVIDVIEDEKKQKATILEINRVGEGQADIIVEIVGK